MICLFEQEFGEITIQIKNSVFFFVYCVCYGEIRKSDFLFLNKMNSKLFSDEAKRCVNE